MSNENENYSQSNPQDSSKLHSFKVVVNGTETIVKINENVPLKTLVQKALEQTGNVGREKGEWRLKWDDQLLDLQKKIKEYEFPEDVILFLSLKSGEGGCNDR